MAKNGTDTVESQLTKRLVQMNKMAIELRKINVARFAKDDRYIRIGGESFRAVSLRDGHPLCGCVEHGAKQLATIDQHFQREPRFLDPDVLEEKKERKLQCWIIKESLVHNRDMRILLKPQEDPFDKLLFALDEVSLGNNNHQIKDIPGLHSITLRNTKAVRCDLLAVGKKDDKTFPVIIELKSSRNMEELIEQVGDFAELMCRFSMV